MLVIAEASRANHLSAVLFFCLWRGVLLQETWDNIEYVAPIKTLSVAEASEQIRSAMQRMKI